MNENGTLKNSNNAQGENRVPIGVSSQGETVFAHVGVSVERARLVVVSGKEKTAFLQSFIRSETKRLPARGASFIVLSPKSSYVELLREKSADITLPYLHSTADYRAVLEGLSPLFSALKNTGKRTVYLVLDGLETLGDQEDKFLKSYTLAIEKTQGSQVEILCGVEMEKSAFSGNPGVFVGAGNALLSVDEPNFAFFARVERDFSLGAPQKIYYGEGACFD